MCTVYILRCANGSLYVGRTCDLSVRVAEHELGRGSIFTAARRPVLLVYQELFQTNAAAARRERQLKRWTTAKKEALIRGDMTSIHRLAVRRRFEKKRT
jgi:putative endonuclease